MDINWSMVKGNRWVVYISNYGIDGRGGQRGGGRGGGVKEQYPG